MDGGIAASIMNLKRKTNSFFGLKTISYFTSALLLLFQRTSFKFDFSMSGEHSTTSAMSICVGSAHGYGQTPSAVPYNGLLDMTLVQQPQLFQIFFISATLNVLLTWLYFFQSKSNLSITSRMNP